jgi:hypothetical protein
MFCHFHGNFSSISIQGNLTPQEIFRKIPSPILPPKRFDNLLKSDQSYIVSKTNVFEIPMSGAFGWLKFHAFFELGKKIACFEKQ